MDGVLSHQLTEGEVESFYNPFSQLDLRRCDGRAELYFEASMSRVWMIFDQPRWLLERPAPGS
ncbi:Hypothetical protein CAP_5729 [Chondromyces apiculatus DSM 436]|uniref:Uncharacterized protein n=1 Tax=Chondromyces apiculatus DSM 436 TaxID=1192034 RepID=A0A017T2Z9_9BACT|nr:Hypothetical protein CAP_5729 [Chondromyces apiculatus DSM 436]